MTLLLKNTSRDDYDIRCCHVEFVDSIIQVGGPPLDAPLLPGARRPPNLIALFMGVSHLNWHSIIACCFAAYCQEIKQACKIAGTPK